MVIGTQRSRQGAAAIDEAAAGLHITDGHRHGVFGVFIAHGDRITHREGGVCFSNACCGITTSGHQWCFVGARDGDGDCFAITQRIAVVVCGGNGVGKNDRFTRFQEIKISGLGVEAPIEDVGG